MKEIKLSQGSKNAGKYVALVDDSDYDYLMQWKWFAKTTKSDDKTYNYAICNFIKDGKWTSSIMHRMIMNPNKGDQIDHIDHNGLNNQKSNLRICTHSQNQMNRYGSSSTGYKGVYKSRHGNYFASIQYDNKRISLGTYKTPEEAAQIYDNAAMRYHKEYANLNFPKTQLFDREFVEWIAMKINNQQMSVTFQKKYSFAGNDYTLDELYQYWIDNVKDK